MYDVIIIGARCAGAPTAMLLASKGFRVLLADKVAFPRDTLSTHYIHQPGVSKLKRWGLLKSLQQSNCPPIQKVSLFSGPSALRSLFMNFASVGDAYCPRRTVLDSILVEAASRAGAKVQERFTIRDILQDNGLLTGVVGDTPVSKGIRERARLIVGADGVNSTIARMVKAPSYSVSPMKNCYTYAYWSGVPLSEGEIYFRKGRAATAFPTHDNLACITAVWPTHEAAQLKNNLQVNYLKSLQLFPELFSRLRRAEQQSSLYSTNGKFPNYFRKAWGPGWALVGDAGYHKDPITALGITDAFRDAELLAEAIERGLSSSDKLQTALVAYERERNNAARCLYEFTLEIDSLGMGQSRGTANQRKFGQGKGSKAKLSKMKCGGSLYLER